MRPAPRSLNGTTFLTDKKSICILPFALEIALGLATMYALWLFLCGDMWGTVVV